MPIQDLRVELPAGRLFVRRWPGDDPAALPIVLLHDSLGAVALWRDFPMALGRATGRTVIAYDRLGYGLSDPVSGPQPVDFIAAEARTVFPVLCEALGLGRVMVLGHSVGGGMAVHIAAAHPDRCAGLITVAAQAFVEDRTLEGIREAEALFQDPLQVERLARYHGDKARWVLDAWIDTWLHGGVADWSLEAVLPRVCCPALVLHGEQDEFGSDLHPRRIGEGIGVSAQVVVLPETRHMPHREHPQTVIEHIAGFLAPLD